MPREPRPSPFIREIMPIVGNRLKAERIAGIAWRLANDRIPPMPTPEEEAKFSPDDKLFFEGYTLLGTVAREGLQRVFLEPEEEDPNNLRI